VVALGADVGAIDQGAVADVVPPQAQLRDVHADQEVAPSPPDALDAVAKIRADVVDHSVSVRVPESEASDVVAGRGTRGPTCDQKTAVVVPEPAIGHITVGDSLADGSAAIDAPPRDRRSPRTEGDQLRPIRRDGKVSHVPELGVEHPTGALTCPSIPLFDLPIVRAAIEPACHLGRDEPWTGIRSASAQVRDPESLSGSRVESGQALRSARDEQAVGADREVLVGVTRWCGKDLRHVAVAGPDHADRAG